MKLSWPSIEDKNNLYFLLVLYLSGGWLQEARFITAESRDHRQPAAARQICPCHIRSASSTVCFFVIVTGDPLLPYAQDLYIATYHTTEVRSLQYIL